MMLLCESKIDTKNVAIQLEYRHSFNPNQTKLFLPLKDQGGEESRRSSICNTIMLFFTQITHIRSQMKV